MFKKFLSMAAAIFFISLNPVAAQEVTVIGMGADKNEALRDASRLAVEQVVGTYIDSRTLMNNLMIQLDEVFKKSGGYIKNIQILKEDQLNDSTYRIQAKIDVDTTPDGKLIDELTMLMQLNDPRIAVVVFDSGKGNQTRNDLAETFLNEKLLSMNFSHILNSSMVAKLSNTALLKNILSNSQKNYTGETDNALDYLVIGNYSSMHNKILVPNSNTAMSMEETNLTNSKSTLKVEIIKYDTGEIVGTFIADGNAVGITEENAKNESLRNASAVAAEKLEETFKKFSSKTSQGITFTITATNDLKLQQAINELRSLGIVDSVYIREQKKNSAVLSVESAQKPNTILTALKGRTKFRITVEEVTNSACKLRIS